MTLKNAQGHWTPAGKRRVARLWASKMSASNIAKELGVTKDAVLGIAHRIGVQPRPSPIKHSATVDRQDMSERRMNALKLPKVNGPLLPAIKQLMEAP